MAFARHPAAGAALLALLSLASAGTPSHADEAGDHTLRLLGADARQMRFVGEADAHEYPVYLTGAEAGSRAHLRLAYSNAAAVMAEASRMKVSVNGVLLSESAIASPAGSDQQTVDIDVPAGLLEPGVNAVTVAVQQRHGVDCTIPATYELWTQLDGAHSGFAFAAAMPGALDLGDIAALRPRANGSTAIRLIVPKGVEAARLDQLIRAAELIALRGRFAHPEVEVVSAPSAEPGLDLAVGTPDELRQTGLVADGDDIQPTTLRAGGGPDSYLLMVSGATPTELDQSIASLLPTALPDPPGTNAGLQALVRLGGRPVRGGSSTSLHDLGVASQEFSGRLFRTGFDVLMPPDFYAADYGKLTLRIDAGYVAGLDRGSQILVRVNDRDAASLALSNSNGDIFRARPITLSLTDMRPGFNHVQIEAQLATAADKACEPRATMEAKKRFILLDTSTLELPPVARIAEMPNLAVTAASGYPYAHPAEDGALYIPHPDADSIAAAATFVLRSATAAGVPLPVAVITSRAPADGTSAIIVGAVNDLPEKVLTAMDIDATALRDSWSHIEAQTAASARLEAAHRSGTLADDAIVQGGGRKTTVLFHKWSNEVSAGRWQFDPTALVADGLRRFVGVSRENLQFWNQAEPRYTPEAGARLILAQHAAPGEGGATWTLIVAPSSELLERGVDRLTTPSVWNRLTGRIASLGATDSSLTLVPASSGYFIVTVPWRPGNMRLIAAGWLSSHLSLYLGGFVLICVLLALATAAVIRRSGVRS